MKAAVLVTIAALVAAGCSGPATRAQQNRAEFDSWPAEVQDNVLAGKIDLGYTPAQVRVALGEPDGVTQRRDFNGDSEVWTYRQVGPRFSWGFGVGSRTGSTAVGVGVGDDSGRRGNAVEVTFQGGKVSSIENTVR